MGIFTKDAPPEQRAIVSSAARLKIKGTEAKRQLARRESWQEEAWAVFDTVGEVKYSTTYLGNALARLVLIPAERKDRTEAPTKTDNAAAVDALARLEGPSGGHAEIMRQLGINFTVPGECYLVGFTVDDVEHWQIRSIDDVEMKNERLFLKEPTVDMPELALTDDDLIVRIWIPHSRHMMKADSPLHGVLEVCEDLLIASRASRAASLSRAVNSGFLAVPSELTFGPADPTLAEGGDDEKQDPFMKALIETMEATIQNQGSAGAVSPIVVRGASEHLKELRHIDVTKKLDEGFDLRIERALTRLAQGLNVPVEVVKGLADVNHWTAWQIEESTFKAHIEPLAISAVNALTTGYFQPMLKAAGVDSPENFVIWYDPSKLVIRPNRTQDAKESHDKLIISDATLRHELGYTDDDAPTDQELLRRLVTRRGIMDAPITEELLRLIDPSLEVDRPDPNAPPPEEDEDEPPPEEDEPTPDEEDDEGEVPDEPTTAALVAAASTNFGERLAGIDRSLRDRLAAAADASLRRALEKVGARLRSKTRGDKSLAGTIAAVPNGTVAATLGRGIVASLGQTDEELLDSAFESFGQSFESWVSAAQGQALNLVPDLAAVERAEAEAQQETDRAEAWVWFEGALLALARERLYDPSPEAPTEGEFDPTMAVPFGLVREAMARAGGAAGPEAGAITAALETVLKSLGLATGWFMKALFARKRVMVDAYQWVYGDFPRAQPYEPHRALDGQLFRNFDDESTRNEDGWPPDTNFLPGDHAGCLCDWLPVMVEVEG